MKKQNIISILSSFLGETLRVLIFIFNLSISSRFLAPHEMDISSEQNSETLRMLAINVIKHWRRDIRINSIIGLIEFLILAIILMLQLFRTENIKESNK